MLAATVTGCESPTALRYTPSADGAHALRRTGAAGIVVEQFRPPTNFDARCRGFGAIEMPDGLAPAEYIRRAFEEEIKAAGVHAGAQAPQLRIGGAVERLQFSTSGAAGPFWEIGLELTSSSGATQRVWEFYRFAGGFSADAACQNAAAAFSRAVQNLVAKAIQGPVFASSR